MSKIGHPTPLTAAILVYEEARDALIQEMVALGDSYEEIAKFLLADATPMAVKLIAERPR